MYLGNVSLDVDANTKIVPKVFQMYYTHVHRYFPNYPFKKQHIYIYIYCNHIQKCPEY